MRCVKSHTVADFGLSTSKRNRPNKIDPLEEVLRRPYDLNKLSDYISENEPNLNSYQILTYNSILNSVFLYEGKIFFFDAPGKTFVTKSQGN